MIVDSKTYPAVLREIHRHDDSLLESYEISNRFATDIDQVESYLSNDILPPEAMEKDPVLRRFGEILDDAIS